jgi:nicotinate dehydrogenase subunit B
MSPNKLASAASSPPDAPRPTAWISRSSVDWASYPILRFSEAPQLAIDLVDRPTEPPLGAGEAACTPVGPALAKAVFDATGVRLRRIPFTPERVKAALNNTSI